MVKHFKPRLTTVPEEMSVDPYRSRDALVGRAQRVDILTGKYTNREIIAKRLQAKNTVRVYTGQKKVALAHFVELKRELEIVEEDARLLFDRLASKRCGFGVFFLHKNPQMVELLTLERAIRNDFILACRDVRLLTKRCESALLILELWEERSRWLSDSPCALTFEN